MVAAVLALVLVVSTLRLFVWPSEQAPRRVDAIVLLGGVGNGIDAAFRLARRGYSRRLVVSLPGYYHCPGSRGLDLEVTCLWPEPVTTQGEARAIGRLAARDHWQSVLVVARRAQVTRARMRIDRCYRGRLLVTGVSPALSDWPHQIAYEWGALVKALVWQRGC